MAAGPQIMMKLGVFSFSLNTAAYQDLDRSTSFTWADQARIGGSPALQFVGKDAETITLRGTIFPHFRGGLSQVETMRVQASIGTPLLMVSGTGKNLGKWVIDKIGEKHTTFFSDGTPRKIDFDLSLKRYS